MKLIRKAGATSNIVQVFIQDSSSTVGAGLTGLVFNSGSLTAYYHRDTDTTATAISLVTMTVGTFTSSGFKEIDATNMPGWYQLCPPDAALAAGAKSVGIHLKGATNMAPLPIEIDLVAYDPMDAVHLGLSCLPNTAVTTNASLLTSGTGTDQLSVTSGRIDIGKALGTAVTLDANNVLNVSTKYLGGTLQTARDIGASVLLSAGTGTGQLDFTSGVVKANATQWLGGTIPAVNVTGVPLVDMKYILGTLSAGAAGYVGIDWGHVNAPTTAVNLSGTTINLCNTTTTVTNQLTAAAIATGVWTDTTAGDFTTALSIGKSIMNGVSLGTGLTVASVSGAVGSVTGAVGSVTGNVGGNVVGSVGSVTGAVGSVTGAVGSVTGNVGGNVVGSVASVTGAVGSVTGNVGGNVVGSVASVTGAVGSVTGLTASNLDTTISSRLASSAYVSPTTALTESYSTLHAAPTEAQLLFEIRSLLAEKSVTSTTLTAKKIDGSTTAMTFTLDSSSSPTSITRAS